METHPPPTPQPTPCQLWQYSTGRRGYGKTTIDGRTVSAHRKAWIEAYGAIPDGLCVLHRCDNPPCFALDHLFLGTKGENADDKIAKGRQQFGERVPTARLTAEQVRQIRREVTDGASQNSVAERFGVHRATISCIVNRKSWAWLE